MCNVSRHKLFQFLLHVYVNLKITYLRFKYKNMSINSGLGPVGPDLHPNCLLRSFNILAMESNGRAPDKEHKLTSIDFTCVISSPNPMFDPLLESSHRDNSNKWSTIGFGEEIGIRN